MWASFFNYRLKFSIQKLNPKILSQMIQYPHFAHYGLKIWTVGFSSTLIPSLKSILFTAFKICTGWCNFTSRFIFNITFLLFTKL